MGWQERTYDTKNLHAHPLIPPVLPRLQHSNDQGALFCFPTSMGSRCIHRRKKKKKKKTIFFVLFGRSLLHQEEKRKKPPNFKGGEREERKEPAGFSLPFSLDLDLPTFFRPKKENELDQDICLGSLHRVLLPAADPHLLLHYHPLLWQRPLHELSQGIAGLSNLQVRERESNHSLELTIGGLQLPPPFHCFLNSGRCKWIEPMDYLRRRRRRRRRRRF